MKITFKPLSGTTSGTPGTVTALSASSVMTLYAIIFNNSASAISIGSGAGADSWPIPANDWYVIQYPPGRPGDGFDLKDWNVKSASASVAYKIEYA